MKIQVLFPINPRSNQRIERIEYLDVEWTVDPFTSRPNIKKVGQPGFWSSLDSIEKDIVASNIETMIKVRGFDSEAYDRQIAAGMAGLPGTDPRKPIFIHSRFVEYS